MSDDKTELNYMVWQYLEEEAPSLAAQFQKLKDVKAKEGFKVTLAVIYDIYIKNNSDTNKRQIEQETNELSTNKKSCLDREKENNKEFSISETNENKTDDKSDKPTTEDENNKKKGKSSSVDEKLCSAQKESSDKDIKSSDDKRPSLNAKGKSESNNKRESSAKGKSESNNKKRKMPLLPKPPSNKKSKRKRPLLAAPLSSFHQSDPNANRRGNSRKPLLPGLVPTIEPSGRKTLLAEPLRNSSRNERKTLLSEMPMHTYLEEEKIRRTLLTEPSQLLVPEERTRKPLLMEPIPPPLMKESTSKIDRMALLDESLSLNRLHPDSNERISLLNHPLLSDQLDALYRRERKSLLDEPPSSLMIDYLKRKEKQSLLMDPPLSEPYYDSRERKVGLLTELPLSLGMDDDMKRKRRAILSDHSPPLPSREFAMDSLDYSDSSDRHLYSRNETSSLPKSLIYTDMPEYDDSSHLFTRRVQTKESSSDTSNWKDKGILLAELENYLKNHLSRSSNITERNSLLVKPDDHKEYEASGRVFDPSRMSPESYQCYMREKTALLARKEYHHSLPESFGFAQNVRVDKSGSDLFIRKEKARSNIEALMPASSNRRNYEESLKSRGYDFNSELSLAYRRASGNEFHSLDRDIERISYERYGGKMGFL